MSASDKVGKIIRRNIILLQNEEKEILAQRDILLDNLEKVVARLRSVRRTRWAINMEQMAIMNDPYIPAGDKDITMEDSNSIYNGANNYERTRRGGGVDLVLIARMLWPVAVLMLFLGIQFFKS